MDQYQALRELPLLGVLQALGFTEWKSRKNNTEWFGKCPVHQGKSNKGSFSFDATGKYFCFSCSQKGRGAIDVCMAIRQVNFREAVTFLEGIRGAIPAQPIQTPASDASEPISQNPAYAGSYEKYYQPSEWLAKRGLTEETLKRYGVGLYSNPKRRSIYTGRVMFPIFRCEDGIKVGYLARNTDPKEGESKYEFPKGFQKSLEVFGAWQIKNEVKQLPLRTLFLVESPFAVLKFAQLGFRAVSVFGWTVSDQQIDILASLAKGLYYLPDRNVREQATEQAGRLSRRLWCRFPELPNEINDPEQLSAEMIRSLT